MEIPVSNLLTSYLCVFLVVMTMLTADFIYRKIRESLSEPTNPNDELKHNGYLSIEEILKSNIGVVSLKRISRFAVRKNIRKEADVSSDCFRSYLQKILLPASLSRYLMYDEDF